MFVPVIYGVGLPLYSSFHFMNYFLLHHYSFILWLPVAYCPHKSTVLYTLCFLVEIHFRSLLVNTSLFPLSSSVMSHFINPDGLLSPLVFVFFYSSDRWRPCLTSFRFHSSKVRYDVLRHLLRKVLIFFI